MKIVPVIDLFAGPGGLGEGFSAYGNKDTGVKFRIALSIEKNRVAHRTLELRSFVRQFERRKLPAQYYQYLREEISREALFDAFPEEACTAKAEAWMAELGNPEYPDSLVDERIRQALNGVKEWLLIGGPPCQAYSLIGRSRIRGESEEKYEQDQRHYLYREYLRVLAVHQPPVFVMENVKGILSAAVGGKRIFERIQEDLQSPCESIKDIDTQNGTIGSAKCTYRLRSLAIDRDGIESEEFFPRPPKVQDFIVRSEKYGIPQARHRIFLVGIRNDIHEHLRILKPAGRAVTIDDVISDLPKLRSGISDASDSGFTWVQTLQSILKEQWFKSDSLDRDIRREIRKTLDALSSQRKTGENFIEKDKRNKKRKPRGHSSWYSDHSLSGVSNHSSRSHIPTDLHRYLFAATFARVKGRSPLLRDFPPELLPAHANVQDALDGSMFSDRFRVQCKGRPSTTVTSHISKDGHYFIHYDPRQCRSLTVREAARLQTFPDNYFFEGNRTEQYVQVGNAVPPLLAFKIAGCIASLFEGSERARDHQGSHEDNTAEQG